MASVVIRHNIPMLNRFADMVELEYPPVNPVVVERVRIMVNRISVDIDPMYLHNYEDPDAYVIQLLMKGLHDYKLMGHLRGYFSWFQSVELNSCLEYGDLDFEDH